MEIEIIDGNGLSSAKNQELLKFIFKCFGKNNSTDRKLLYFSPTYKHLFLYEKDKLVSYLRIIKRETLFEKKGILIGGIGDVCTDSEYRGKGFAKILLKKAMDIFHKEGFDIGLLQTNIKKGGKLYGDFGFVPVKKSYKFTDSMEKQHITKSQYVMMAAVKSTKTLDKILKSKTLLNIGEGDW